MQLLLEFHTCALLAVATSATLSQAPAASDSSQIALSAQKNMFLSISPTTLPQRHSPAIFLALPFEFLPFTLIFYPIIVLQS